MYRNKEVVIASIALGFAMAFSSPITAQGMDGAGSSAYYEYGYEESVYNEPAVDPLPDNYDDIMNGGYMGGDDGNDGNDLSDISGTADSGMMSITVRFESNLPKYISANLGDHTAAGLTPVNTDIEIMQGSTGITCTVEFDNQRKDCSGSITFPTSTGSSASNPIVNINVDQL